ncbi:MAG: GMC family oxidoreductase N-terminal domain-containing protein [Chlamydiales bacterium]|nr:GMC family oxidoreductase N-terminal domain-containing protein [Chlamydiales bacterium]
MLLNRIVGCIMGATLTMSSLSSGIVQRGAKQRSYHQSSSSSSSSESYTVFNPSNCKIFDYVIIGAGTAGSEMAYYLSNNKKTSVLVLEEGPNMDTDPFVLNQDYPAGNISSNVVASTQMSSNFRHTFYHEWFTIPMAGLNAPPVQNRPILYGGARLAGGTSATNGQLFIRPGPQILDEWVALTGDAEYGMGYIPFGTSTKMLKHFKEIETYLPLNSSEPELYWHAYGHNVPLDNTIFNRQQSDEPGPNIFANSIQNFTIATFGSNWVPNVDTFPGPSPFAPFAPGPAYDRNNPNYQFHITAKTQVEQRADTTRSHSSREYLLAVNSTDVPESPNVPVVYRDYDKQEDFGINGRRLHVIYNATMLKIDWKKHRRSTDDVKARSVTYLRDGVEHTAKIGKKLILCAGISSAAILLKNGVGPADQLAAAGIPLVVENDNVGQNIQNHPILGYAIAQSPIDGVVRNVTARGRIGNTATLTLNNVAGLNVGDYINVSGVGAFENVAETGSGNEFNATGYNGLNMAIQSISGNNISYYNVGDQETLVPGNNSSLSTGGTVSSRVIKVDQFRAGPNSNVVVQGKLPYGWDGLDGGITPANIARPAKWSVVSTFGSNMLWFQWFPNARGSITVLSDDPLHPVKVDLGYLFNPADVTDYIAISRRVVNLIDYQRSQTGGNNLNYDLGTAPSRAAVLGSAGAAVTQRARNANVATLTFTTPPSVPIAVGTLISVTGIPDPSFNATSVAVTAVTSTTVSYANVGANVATTSSSGNIMVNNVTFRQRTGGIATITLAAAPSTAISVGGFVTVTDIPDTSFNMPGAYVTAVTSTSISYSNPGPDVPSTASIGSVSDQAAFVTYLKNAYNQNHHFACSCQMRDTKENGGVVDAYANVFGTKNVMVCDVSAFPENVDANTAGVCYAFTKKIYDDLVTGRNPKSPNATSMAAKKKATKGKSAKSAKKNVKKA